jgi:predicted Na+-dependent transporter
LIEETLLLITQAGMFLFIVAGMAAMGLNLTVPTIVEPLRDVRMVVLLLVVNFVVVPAVAIATTRILPMDDAAIVAVTLIACCAGAPFLPKLAHLAKADAATSVGVMVLLMVVTVVYAPIVVPLVVEGAEVEPMDIATSLIVLMIIPLAVGLFVRARYTELATSWVGPATQASTVGLLLGLVAAILVSWQDVIGAIGTWLFVGTAVVLVTGLVSGYLAGYGRSKSDMTLLGLATAQRNIAAAIVVAASLGGDVVVLTMVGAIIIPIVLIVVAGELGKRLAPAADAGDAAVETDAAS